MKCSGASPFVVSAALHLPNLAWLSCPTAVKLLGPIHRHACTHPAQRQQIASWTGQVSAMDFFRRTRRREDTQWQKKEERDPAETSMQKECIGSCKILDTTRKANLFSVLRVVWLFNNLQVVFDGAMHKVNQDVGVCRLCLHRIGPLSRRQTIRRIRLL